MKIRTKALLISLFCLLAALSYFFFSYMPLNTELQLTPEWTCYINSTKSNLLEGETPLPFRLGSNTGYFTPSGKIVLNERIQYKATTSERYFSLYNSDAKSIAVFNPDGSEQCIINSAGFPFIQQDRIFLMLPGGSSFAKINSADGSFSAIYEHTAPITVFNSSAAGICAGFADGEFLIFDKDGNKKITLVPGGSEYSLILGGAISNNGNMFACVSGQNPQRLILYSDEINYQKIIFHEFLKTTLKRQTFVYFSNDDNFVYFDCGDSLAIVDTANLETIHIPLGGMVLDIQQSPIANCIFVLSRRDNNYKVTIFEDFKKPAGEFNFNASSAFILAKEKSLYIGADDKISRITVSKE